MLAGRGRPAGRTPPRGTGPAASRRARRRAADGPRTHRGLDPGTGRRPRGRRPPAPPRADRAGPHRSGRSVDGRPHARRTPAGIPWWLHRGAAAAPRSASSSSPCFSARTPSPTATAPRRRAPPRTRPARITDARTRSSRRRTSCRASRSRPPAATPGRPRASRTSGSSSACSSWPRARPPGGVRGPSPTARARSVPDSPADEVHPSGSQRRGPGVARSSTPREPSRVPAGPNRR